MAINYCADALPCLIHEADLLKQLQPLVVARVLRVFIDRRFGSLEADSASQASSVETISRRQNTYIDRRNEQHQDFVDDLRQMSDRLDRLCEALASRESEVICND